MLVNEDDAVGSRRNSENVSFKEPDVGAFVVASSRNEIVDPSVTPCCSSLKNDGVLSEAVLWIDPVTDPDDDEDVIRPFVEKFEIETVFD